MCPMGQEDLRSKVNGEVVYLNYAMLQQLLSWTSWSVVHQDRQPLHSLRATQSDVRQNAV